MGVFDVNESNAYGVSCEAMNITDIRLFLTQSYHFLNEWTTTINFTIIQQRLIG